jgi:hypothetical protein
MRKPIGYIPLKLTALIVVSAIFILSACNTSKGNGFAIYLTRDDIPPTQMPGLSQVDLETQPFISITDIVSYNAQTHELKLTPDSFERISRLEVPVRGRSFVVCVNRKPTYWGAFWTPISSISFEGVTIWQPLSTAQPHIITLELGYPGPAFYSGEDPRNNQEVKNSLEQAGKLITRLSMTSVAKLPRSMKGYELYSWSEDSEWRFTLITGTNRNKTLEEIISNEDFISEAGWVQIQVAGVDAIKAVLSKLPPGEEIMWLIRTRSEMSPPSDIQFNLPPQPTLAVVKAYAEQLGLSLSTLPVV